MIRWEAPTGRKGGGLLEYVKDEYRAKNCKELDVTEWELVSCTRDSHRQRNGKFVFLGSRLCLACLWVLFRILPSNILFLNLVFDCGVFMCMFGDFISKDCPLIFNEDHIGCVSFVAGTQSYESMINLCFTTPATFIFTKFVPNKLNNYLRYATVALFT
jgi:hypothetical protein